MKNVNKTFIVMGIIIATLSGCTQTKTRDDGHSFETSWTSDEYSHWHACIDEGCEDIKKDEAKHILGKWIIDEELTTSKQGKKHKQCTVCGRRLVEETIDKIPGEVIDDSNLTFTKLNSGNYSVKAASKSVEKVVIPNNYNGKPVSVIEDDAFYNCSSLTSIEIPNSVTSIGWGAFYNCSSLTSIIIPKSVTYIGSNAFSHCSSLIPLVVPDTVISIGENAFSYCESLTSITIPNSVTSIGWGAFYNCSSLQTINFVGTSAQWNAISKDECWNDKTPANMLIHCSDGDIRL